MSQTRPNPILGRAMAASSALVVAAVAVTGVFVAKIVSSSAATTTAGTSTTSTNNTGLNSGSDATGGGQLTAPQQNQAPVSGSHGS